MAKENEALKRSQVSSQVRLIKRAKRLLLGLQAAALIGDEGLICEGAVRLSNCLAPLAALPVKSAMLLKAFLHCLTALQSVADVTWTKRSLAGSVAIRMIYCLIDLCDSLSEDDLRTTITKTPLPLIQTLRQYLEGPVGERTDRLKALGDGELPLIHAQTGELRHLQEFIMQHPKGPSMSGILLPEIAAAKPSTPVDAKGKKAPEPAKAKGKPDPAAAAASHAPPPADLVAHLFPRLPVATTQELVAGLDQPGPSGLPSEDPRYIEVIYRVAEVAFQRHQYQEVKDIAKRLLPSLQVSLFPSRLGGTLPPLTQSPVLFAKQNALKVDRLERSPEGRWTLEKGLAALETHMPTDEILEAAGGKEKYAALLLLQKQWRACLQIRRMKLKAREARARDAPWVSRGLRLLGLVVTREAIDKARALGAMNPETAEAAAAQKDGVDTAREALRCFARAAEMAARGGRGGDGAAWELVNSCKGLHNALRLLLAEYRDDLIGPVDKGYWAIQDAAGALTPVTTPMPSAPVAEPATRSVKGGQGPPGASASAQNKSTVDGGTHQDDLEDDVANLADLEGIAEGGAGPSDTDGIAGRFVCLPARENIVRALRVSLGRLLRLVDDLKHGDAQLFHTVVPYRQEEAATSAADQRPVTALTEMSLGSDAVPRLWFQSIPALDMEWTSRFVLLSLNLMRETAFYGALFSCGDMFNSLTEGKFAEAVLPLIKQACPIIGQDIVPYQLALEAVIRDKNTAQEELDKCRAAVRSAIGDRSPLSFEKGAKIQKKKRRYGVSGPGGSGSVAGSRVDAQSMARSSAIGSSISKGTGVSYRSGRSQAQPDSVVLAQNYSKCIDTLDKKGEKWLKAQALNELGGKPWCTVGRSHGPRLTSRPNTADVHAHFADWTKAFTAWSDCIDLMVGPYQAIRNWRKDLKDLKPEDLLRRFGAARILLSLTVLGKIAHFALCTDLQGRVECAALASELVMGLFACSAVHPQRRLEFAGYYCHKIWEGEDLLLDPYQCSAGDLELSLEVLVRVLLANNLALAAFAPICLLDHVARRQTRDAARVAIACALRAEACAMEGRLTESSEALLRVLSGLDLPDTVSGLYRTVHMPEGQAPPNNNRSSGPPLLTCADLYDASQRPTSDRNRAVVERIIGHQLHPELSKEYGQVACGLMQGARARFVIAVLRQQDLFVDTDPVTGALLTVFEPLAPPPGSAPVDPKAKGKDAKAAPPKKEPPKKEEPKKDDGKGAKGAAKGKDTAATAADPLFAGDTGTWSGQMLQRAAAVLHEVSFSAQQAAASLTGLDKASPIFVVARSQLSLAEVRRAQMLPAQALGHALRALDAIWQQSSNIMSNEVRAQLVRLPPAKMIRTALLGEVWCQAVVLIAQVCLEMGQLDRALEIVTAAQPAFENLRAERMFIQLRLVHARAKFAGGESLAGLRELAEIETRMRRLQVSGLDLATVIFERAAVLDSLGLRADSEPLFSGALSLLRTHFAARGLHSPPLYPFAPPPPGPVPVAGEQAPPAAASSRPGTAGPPPPSQSMERRRFVERLVLTIPGLDLLVEAILRESRSQFRRRRFQLAADLAREALDLLPRARLPPQTHACTALQLSRCLRHLCLTAGVKPGADGCRTDLEEAVNLLTRAIRWLLTDGGQDFEQIRACYSELALDYLLLAEIEAQGDHRMRAVWAMTQSLKTATVRDLFLLAPQNVKGFSLEGAPVWALELIGGREEVHLAEQQAHAMTPPGSAPAGGATPAAPVAGSGSASALLMDDPERTGGLLLRHLIGLQSARHDSDWALEGKRRVQQAILHRFMRASCPQYLTDCCLDVALAHDPQPLADLLSNAPAMVRALLVFPQLCHMCRHQTLRGSKASSMDPVPPPPAGRVPRGGRRVLEAGGLLACRGLSGPLGSQGRLGAPCHRGPGALHPGHDRCPGRARSPCGGRPWVFCSGTDPQAVHGCPGAADQGRVGRRCRTRQRSCPSGIPARRNPPGTGGSSAPPVDPSHLQPGNRPQEQDP